MTNQEILNKAIEKALSRSWDMYDHVKWSWKVVNNPSKTESYHYFVKAQSGGLQHSIDISHILFDPDFAKALWGEEATEYVATPDWEYHLQKMVVAEDPIQYLGENLWPT